MSFGEIALGRRPTGRGPIREMDRAEMLRVLGAMDETEYRPIKELARRAGMSPTAVMRTLERIGDSGVEWVLRSLGYKSQPSVYCWRRKPGTIEKVRRA